MSTACRRVTSPPATRRSKHGTIVRFKPDAKIFEEVSFSFDTLSNRLREMAFLNKGLKIVIEDERDDRDHTFLYKGGIIEFIKHLNQNKTPIHPKVLFFEGKKDGIEVEVALQYNDGYQENVFSFANNINTREGGTHLTGFRAALTGTLSNYAQAQGFLKTFKGAVTGDDVREGLTAVVSVRIPDPQFEGQTKAKLGNSEVKGLVQQIVNDRLAEVFEEDPTTARKIADKCVRAAQAREAARKARELTRKGGATTRGWPPSSPTARSGNRSSARSSSSRVTPRAVPRSRAATGRRRPCCRCAARSSMPRRRATTRSSPIRKSGSSSRPWERASGRKSSTSASSDTTR